MSDIMPNVNLGRARLELQREELRLNMLRMNVRLLELEEEKDRIEANKDATAKSIDEMTAALTKDKEKANG